jgi:topoisomerase IV subunit A
MNEDNINNEELDNEEFDNSPEGEEIEESTSEKVIHVSGMYENWFLDYASYVILERAVPALNDGLKPVHRRILHSMHDLEDGRYNKVANIIGHTMKYHPHGDASIGDAMIQIGQKDLLIDTQGNWGNTLTGDGAAAPRYIEARLSKFAKEVVFNPKTTKWLTSYDGRNKEPLTLPVKFPLLLAQGVEGIAVGLACKILPHNFNELIDASIDCLRGKKVFLYPDFPSGGTLDASNYNEGLRGGRIRCRAKITAPDKKTLLISEIPFGTTTSTLIDSILLANDKGKIKVRKVEDNTSDQVEILVHLHPGVSPDQMIDAMYAFTNCEVSISPNAVVIVDDRPMFLNVNEILVKDTEHTVYLLKWELNIRLGELQEQWHFLSLERIFIENKIYIDFDGKTYEEAIEVTFELLKPHVGHLIREVTRADVEKLLEIRMRRITKHDSDKADQILLNIQEEIALVKFNIEDIINYTINYYKELKKKYGKGRERKTEIKAFETINAAQVAVDNVKLYVNREEGFAGFGLKKDEFVCDCSDIDDIIVFREDGTVLITKISDKAFVGKGVIHIAVFKKNDNRTIYNMIYQDGPKGPAMMKRFAVTAITRDKEYDLTKGKKGSKVLYFTANPNGEAEVLTVRLKPLPKIKKLNLEVDLGGLAIKGRNAAGNILTKYPIRKIEQKEQGVSTLGARKIWFDDVVQRLNDEGRGTFLGSFAAEDKILTIMQSGEYKLTGFDLSVHFDEDMVRIQKFDPEKVISAIYWDGEKKAYYAKRFNIEDSDKKVMFIAEEAGSYLELVAIEKVPFIEIVYPAKKGEEAKIEKINLEEFIGVKGYKAKGKKLTDEKIKEINVAEDSVPYDDVDDIKEIREVAPIPLEEIKFVSETKQVNANPENVEEKEADNEVAKPISEPKKIVKPIDDDKSKPLQLGFDLDL